MKPQLTFGPYFTPTQVTTAFIDQRIEPLGLACEWASAQTCSRLRLFRHRPPHAPKCCRLEHVVFPADQLPCHLECHDFQVVEHGGTTYLPLEALLVQLYRAWSVPRCISTVLDELVSRVPLHSSLTEPVSETGLLVRPAEAQGFRLNTVICHAGQLFVEIGWQPPHQPSFRFHVGICRFEMGDLKSGQWQAPGLVGVAQLLAEPLHILVPGSPANLFSVAGHRFLAAHLPQAATQD